LHDQADLIDGDDVLVEIASRVGDIFVGSLLMVVKTRTIVGTVPTIDLAAPTPAFVAKTLGFEALTTDSGSKPMDLVAMTIEPAAQTMDGIAKMVVFDSKTIDDEALTIDVKPSTIVKALMTTVGIALMPVSTALPIVNVALTSSKTG